MLRIDWSEPLTKGRQVYAGSRTEDSIRNINYVSGFLVGWDRWSDGQFTITARMF